MAEIRDVYSLEFNSSQFQSEVDSAIKRIEDLNSAMADGADVADELAAAQGSLVDILGTEAKGVEQLNQKRNVLVNTQKQVNAETKTGVAVGKQLDATNKQIAVSTGQAAAQQRGLGGTLLQGTRQISQMRRVASTLTFAFRAISAAIPFGLILSFAGPIISFFSSLFKATDESAENMEKLADSTLPLTQRLQIANEELERLNSIEARRGSLTEEEKQKRQQLVNEYEKTSKEIIKIEEERYERQRDLEFEIQATRIKLLGETPQAVEQSYELERRRIIATAGKRFDLVKAEYEALFKEIAQQQDLADRTSSSDASNNVDRLKRQQNRLFQELQDITESQNLQVQNAEREKNKRINDIIKKNQDDAKKKRVEDARRQIEELEQQKELELLNYEEGTEGRLNTELEFMFRMQELQIKFKNELELNETEIAIITEKNLQRRVELITEYYKTLEEKNQKNKGLVGPTAEDLQKQLKELTDGLKAQADLIEDNNQRNLALQLVALEEERNEKLLFAKNTITDKEKFAKEFESIDKSYNKKRADIENEANKQIIQDRIKLLQELSTIAAAQGDKGLVADLEKQIAELKLKFTELNKTVSDGTDETVKETSDKYKQLVDQTSALIQGVSDNVFNVLNAQVDAYIQGLDKAIEKSKSALDEIRANSENYNAQQLEIEKERLEKLEAERAKAVEREKVLGQVQVAINAAIAISKAAAEGGGFASAFTIAATLASLIAGLAQARVAAGNAFFHGVEYLERGNNPRGRDTIPAMLNEGERVITTDTNNKYWDVLSAVHNNRIPANVLNTFAKAYQQGGIKNALGAFGENVSLSSELGDKSIFVNVAQTYSGMENRLERIEAVLTDLPKYMPRTVVSANANGIFKIVEQRQRRKNYSSNWSK